LQGLSLIIPPALLLDTQQRKSMHFMRLLLLASVIAVQPSTTDASLVTYTNFGDWSSTVSGVTSTTIPEPGLDYFFGSAPASVNYAGVSIRPIAFLGIRCCSM